MSDFSRTYEVYRARMQALGKIVAKAEQQFKALDMSAWADIASAVQGRLESDRFKVIVVGEFKRGKSTFINALLTEEVLPAFATPCTAVINEVKWGPEKRAVLHFRNPLPGHLPPLPERAREHIASFADGTVGPMEVEIDELEEYVVIPEDANDQAQAVAESPYEKAEIYWPIQLCQNGVEIIDSPGLNEHGTRTKVTLDYMNQVDAVLFVMSCQALASQSELKEIQRSIRGAGHEHIFFIANRFDEIRPRERDRLVSYGKKVLTPLTAMGSDGVYFLSALDALDGRLNGDDARVERSGIDPLEAGLARFLTKNRGSLKLLAPAQEILKGVREARAEVIPERRGMLDTSEQELRSRYEKERPAFEAADRRRQQIVGKADQVRDRLRKEVERVASAYFRALADKIPRWAEELELETSFSVMTLSPKAKLEEMTAEVLAGLQSQIEEDFKTWQETELKPIVEDRLQHMNDSLSADIGVLLSDLSSLSERLSGTSKGLEESPDVSPMERVLAAAGGFLIAGVGAGLVGGTLGFKEMMKSLGPQIALIAGMFALGLTNPITMIPVLVAGGVLQGVLKGGQITDKVKSKIAEQLAGDMREKADERSRAIADDVYEQTGALRDGIEAGMAVEVQKIREQVECILEELREGREQATQKRAELDASLKVLGALEGEIDDLVMGLVNEVV
ncbi:MAG: dynamin family protein [Sandaracinaceae bacterium]|nr:dynamin family protein [Sandaracinaceae bacterium]